jgi:hypothetical protein
MVAYASADPAAQGVLQVSLLDANAQEMYSTCVTHPAVTARIRARATAEGREVPGGGGCAGHGLQTVCGAGAGGAAQAYI